MLSASLYWSVGDVPCIITGRINELPKSYLAWHLLHTGHKFPRCAFTTTANWTPLPFIPLDKGLCLCPRLLRSAWKFPGLMVSEQMALYSFPLVYLLDCLVVCQEVWPRGGFRGESSLNPFIWRAPQTSAYIQVIWGVCWNGYCSSEGLG